MSHIAVSTLHPSWVCRVRRPGDRIHGVEDHLQPESLWVCVRTGARRGVTEAECADCPYWQGLPTRAEE